MTSCYDMKNINLAFLVLLNICGCIAVLFDLVSAMLKSRVLSGKCLKSYYCLVSLQFPLLLPGGKEFVYESCTPLPTSLGSIEGSYTFVPGRYSLYPHYLFKLYFFEYALSLHMKYDTICKWIKPVADERRVFSTSFG